MANNREEKRAGKDWMTPEQRIIKKSNIKDNFIIFLMIITIFTNVTLSYSVININTSVATFMADVFYNTPVNQDVVDPRPYVLDKNGVQIHLDQDESGKYFYLNEGNQVYPPEDQIQYPPVLDIGLPEGEYIDPSQIGGGGEPGVPHIHAPEGGTIDLQKDEKGKYFYTDKDGKKVYPGEDEIH